MNEEFSEILRYYVLEEQQKNPSANGISMWPSGRVPRASPGVNEPDD